MFNQVTLDTVEVVSALKDDGSGQHEHGEGLKETVQQAAAGLLLVDICTRCYVSLRLGLYLATNYELLWPAAAVVAMMARLWRSGYSSTCLKLHC